MKSSLLILAGYLILVTAGSLLLLNGSMKVVAPVAGVVVAWAAVRALPAARRSWAGKVIAGTVAIAAAAMLDLPVKAAFRLYENRFNFLAEAVHYGDSPAFPQWVGPFRITDTTQRLGVRAFVLNPNPSGITAFVQNRDGAGFNPWSCTPMGKSWSLVQED